MLEQGYYNEPYYQDPNPGIAEAEEPGNSAMFDDEAVRAMLLVCLIFLICYQRKFYYLHRLIFVPVLYGVIIVLSSTRGSEMALN